MFNKFKKIKKYDYAELSDFVLATFIELHALREQWFFAFISESKKYLNGFSNINPLLTKGSRLDSIVLGYQLCCVMGFTMTEGYLSREQFIEFDQEWMKQVSKNDLKQVSVFRERYLDCQGDTDRIEQVLTQDICDALLADFNINTQKNKTGLKNSIRALGIMSQAAISDVFKDERTAKDLRKRIRLS